MARETITKTAEDRAAAALPDPDETRRTFGWTGARAMLHGLPGGALNIAHEALDRHLAGGSAWRDEILSLDSPLSFWTLPLRWPAKTFNHCIAEHAMSPLHAYVSPPAAARS